MITEMNIKVVCEESFSKRNKNFRDVSFNFIGAF